MHCKLPPNQVFRNSYPKDTKAIPMLNVLNFSVLTAFGNIGKFTPTTYLLFCSSRSLKSTYSSRYLTNMLVNVFS